MLHATKQPTTFLNPSSYLLVHIRFHHLTSPLVIHWTQNFPCIFNMVLLWINNHSNCLDSLDFTALEQYIFKHNNPDSRSIISNVIVNPFKLSNQFGEKGSQIKTLQSFSKIKTFHSIRWKPLRDVIFSKNERELET